MKLTLAVTLLLLPLSGCVSYHTHERIVVGESRPGGVSTQLVEYRKTERLTSLVTPEGPVANHAMDSASRYFVESGEHKVELKFLHEVDGVPPIIFGAVEGLWIAVVAKEPDAANSLLLLFDSEGRISDRLVFSRPVGGTVRFDPQAKQLIVFDGHRLFRYQVSSGHIVTVDEKSDPLPTPVPAR